MPQTLHVEQHFDAGAAVRDIVISMVDGLIVPFALGAGLSGAVNSTATGLGGYLAARSDADPDVSEREREKDEVGASPSEERAEVVEVLESYGLTSPEAVPIARACAKRPEAWVDFMMRFELGLEAPNPRRALTSALTIGVAYAAGGFVPLAPYIFGPSVPIAHSISIVATIAALLAFSYVKARLTGAAPMRSALQTTLVGGRAATAAYLIARAIR